MYKDKLNSSIMEINACHLGIISGQYHFHFLIDHVNLLIIEDNSGLMLLITILDFSYISALCNASSVTNKP